MKLQHTSGAVIEDARLKEHEGYFATPTGSVYGNVYSKSDWKRVPEERWEQAPIVIDPQNEWAYFLSSTGGKVHIRNCGTAFDHRFRIVNGNLCVERRVEG